MEPFLLPFDGQRPLLHSEAWVAPTATLVGSVTIEERASVWYGSVLRADGDRITIGAGSNVQDGCVVHADPGLPVVVGERVSVGHRAVLHGCTIGDDVLVGMGAVVLNGAEVPAGSLVAAGVVVLEGARFEPGTLIAGVPAKARRPLSEEECAGIRDNAEDYLRLTVQHREATG